MTPEQVSELVAAAPLPEGWSLTVVAERSFKYRSKYTITATYHRIVRATWHVYRVAAVLPAILEWIEKYPAERDLLVTADPDGWVKSIEEVG